MWASMGLARSLLPGEHQNVPPVEFALASRESAMGSPTAIPKEYAVFSDESSHTDGRYRSIAAVSLPSSPPSLVVNLSKDLAAVLECSTKGELKWRNVDRHGRSNVKRAKDAVDFTMSRLSKGIRIDVLIWDVEDSRHTVPDRDDTANYGRLYFHLICSIVRRRESAVCWHLRPDQLSTIDWDTIRDCLKSVGTWNQRFQAILGEEFRAVAPQIGTFKQVDSKLTPFVQMADLFAGMAAYTRERAEAIRFMLDKLAGQGSLFPPGVTADPPASRKDIGRFQVISHLYTRCKQKRLGVSLNSEACLRTMNPAKPINFWHYEPQHHQDRAPTKGGI